MLNLELSALSSPMVQILMSRGSGTPPLQWQEHPNALAKKRLDALDQAALFGKFVCKDEANANAVRALLYLWAGWTTEAQTTARTAPQRELLYITGLCERHKGHLDTAKAAFRTMDTHAIYEPLGDHVLKAMTNESDAALRSFRETVRQRDQWEPLAFMDLYERAQRGELSQGVWQTVTELQTKEFELLFVHCFAQATGRSIVKKRQMSEEEEQRREQEYRRRMADRRKEAEKRTKLEQQCEVNKAKEKPSNPSQPPPDPRVKLLCPKCSQLLYVNESARGHTTRCVSCKVVFMVPAKKPEPAVHKG